MGIIKPSTKAVKTGNLMVIYGEAGTGKTTVAAQAILDAGDKGLLLKVVEDGVSDNQKSGSSYDLSGVQVHESTIKEFWTKDEHNPGLIDIIGDLKNGLQNGEYDFTDICFDSLNLIYPKIEDFCYNKYYKNSSDYDNEDKAWGAAYGFGGYGITQRMVENTKWFLKPLMEIKAMGVNIFITSHEGRIKVNLKDGTEYQKIAPDFPTVGSSSVATTITNQASHVVYACFDEEVVQKSAKGKTKAIGVEGTGQKRICYTHGDATLIAKWRGKDIPDKIDFDWGMIKKYL